MRAVDARREGMWKVVRGLLIRAGRAARGERGPVPGLCVVFGRIRRGGVRGGVAAGVGGKRESTDGEMLRVVSVIGDEGAVEGLAPSLSSSRPSST